MMQVGIPSNYCMVLSPRDYLLWVNAIKGLFSELWFEGILRVLKTTLKLGWKNSLSLYSKFLIGVLYLICLLIISIVIFV